MTCVGSQRHSKKKKNLYLKSFKSKFVHFDDACFMYFAWHNTTAVETKLLVRSDRYLTSVMLVV